MPDPTITAALCIIGNEILSGRTQDKNLAFIAERLTALGIRLAEVRVVRDDEAAIVEAVQALSGRSEEHTSELQSLMRISYAVFCLKKKTKSTQRINQTQ